MGGRAAPMHLPSVFMGINGSAQMNRLFLKLAIAAAAGGLLLSHPTVAQILAPEPRTEHVEITRAPELESARPWLAIVRWTTTNPRGDDAHYGVVYYGTDPEHLNQTARNPIRLNRAHPETTFRVRLQGLQPETTYYYKVTSVDATGGGDGVESSVSHFTTPRAGEVINNYPQPK